MTKHTHRTLLIGMGTALAAFVVWLVIHSGEHEWSGVDETVIEHFAQEAGRAPTEPLINTDQGDLLLFVFLLAGTAGGFVGGYYFRELFPRKGQVAN